MDIYLPVAEMSVNLFLLLGLGGAIGFLSGVFGVGGGFLMTPLLIFIGIPPPVAVGSEAAQILASLASESFSRMSAEPKNSSQLPISRSFPLETGISISTFWNERLRASLTAFLS